VVVTALMIVVMFKVFILTAIKAVYFYSTILFHFLVVGSVQQNKLTHVSF